MLPRFAYSIACFTALSLLTVQGTAQVSAQRAEAAVRSLPDQGSRFVQALTGSRVPQLLVRVRDRNAALSQGLVPITDTLAVGHRTTSAWAPLREADGVTGVLLAPVREPQMDEVGRTLGRSEASEQTGLTGDNVVVGVVDTGADAAHRAFLNASGQSRIAWFLVFGQRPLGLHPELEEEYGCTADPDETCAIYSGADLDAIIGSSILANLPKDPIGHGTHITSLAAGSHPDYLGVAPDADLVIVAASEVTGAVSDARILLGTRFVFDRATELNQPAVVNISLGSSLGAHDGSSEVEQGLAQLGSGPGRAVVIAAGNSGYVHRDLYPEYPGDKGIHTEVTVPADTEVRVPVITPPVLGQDEVTGSFFVWIATQPNDHISVGFGNGDKDETNLIAPGQSGGIQSAEFLDEGNYDVVIFNGVDDDLGTDIPEGSIFVGVAGTWKAGRVFDLILRGQGNARLWVSGREDLSPAISGTGPLFPRARTSGTVAVPGSHPDIITVGATVNRLSWVDYADGIVSYADEVGVRTFFSASGPNLSGAIKPEIVAPGGGVIGAMAREADPRTSGNFSQFASLGSCSDGVECFVVDDEHGVASGTSMSAPLVSGAVALMMQRDPTLTMAQAKAYLMAGSMEVLGEALGSRAGVGQLHLVGSLRAQERALSDDFDPVSHENCRVVWSDSFVYPGTAPALEGYLLLRDESDQATQINPEDLDVHVDGPGRASVETLGPGLVRIALSGDEGAAGQDLDLSIRVQNQLIAEQTFPIERDPALAEHGFELGGGTCSWHTKSPRTPEPTPLWLFVLTAVLAVARRRRARH